MQKGVKWHMYSKGYKKLYLKMHFCGNFEIFLFSGTECFQRNYNENVCVNLRVSVSDLEKSGTSFT